MDIHPQAKFGKGILMDHGTGIVIGQTAEIGNNVSILQNVTLGGTTSTQLLMSRRRIYYPYTSCLLRPYKPIATMSVEDMSALTALNVHASATHLFVSFLPSS